jgi:hypothetical protein
MDAAEIIHNFLALPVVDEDGIWRDNNRDDIIDILLPPAAKRKRRKV